MNVRELILSALAGVVVAIVFRKEPRRIRYTLAVVTGSMIAVIPYIIG